MEQAQQLPHHRWLIFGVTATGTFMATLDASIVNVTLPIISGSLKANLPLVQWVVSAYLLTISSLLPLFGRAGDMFGRKKIYTLGFLIFTGSSAFCGTSSTIWMLIGSRVIQAIGASMLMANAPAIVSTTFPGKERGRALGMIGTVVALGSMVGPGLGGLMVGAWGWQSIFYLNLPIGLLGYTLGQIFLPVEGTRQGETFDFTGAALFATGMVSLLFLLSHGQEWGWQSPLIGIGSVLTVIMLTLFIYHERRTAHPMIDLSLFGYWPFLAGNLSGLLSFMAMFSNAMLLPFYLHTILALNPSRIGLLMTMFPIVMAVVAPLSGYASEKINPMLLTTAGMGVMAIGLVYLANLGSFAAMWQVALGQAILGAGNGLFQSPNNNSVLSSVHPAKLGLASGISALVRNVGMVSGIAVAISVFEFRRHAVLQGGIGSEASAFLAAYQAALLVGAGFAAIAALISLNRKGYMSHRP